MTLDDVRKKLLAEMLPFRRITKAGTFHGIGLRAWCMKHGVRSSRVVEFLDGRRNPTKDILEALGLEWQIGPKIPRTSYELLTPEQALGAISDELFELLEGHAPGAPKPN